MKDTTIVPMSVVSYIRQTPQKEHLGRQRPAIAAGTLCYAIRYLPNKGYFQYSYTNPEQATEVMNNFISDGTDTEYYRVFNSKVSPNLTIVCAPRKATPHTNA